MCLTNATPQRGTFTTVQHEIMQHVQPNSFADSRMWCMSRCPEARLSLEAGAGAQRPDVLEAGACVHRCPEARLSLEAGLT